MTVNLLFQIDSDLASSQASSRGSSPFLPPAMPLLQVKNVPVMEPYNEAAIDVPPDYLAACGLANSNRSSPSKRAADVSSFSARLFSHSSRDVLNVNLKHLSKIQWICS